MYCIARIHYSLTNKNSWPSNFFNWFSSNLHADTSVLLFIPACCKLLMFWSWFRKHALAFPTYLFPAILTVFLSHPASFILRFDLFCWHESCWLLRKTHDCWCYPQRTLPVRIQENCKYREKPRLCQFGYTLWSLESSHRAQTTSIATGEYPSYPFVLCHLMVMSCVSKKNKERVICERNWQWSRMIIFNAYFTRTIIIFFQSFFLLSSSYFYWPWKHFSLN